ncbi:MAG: hypothetical protein PHV82_09695 [Victivallaceae bacterium]|nr:hypothetical protein [Victivallaceae bacterium]
MKRILMVLLGIGLTGSSALSSEVIKPLFTDQEVINKFHFYRASIKRQTGLVKLDRTGILLSKNAYGPGLYSVTFAVDESHEKFEYHQQYFLFYFNPVIKRANELQEMRKGVEYLYIKWRKSGQVEFGRHMKNNTTILGTWFEPGPQKTSAYAKDTFVIMNVIIPEPGKNLKIYFNKPPEGDADCEFTMPDHPTNGLFGFYNPKAYSFIIIKDIQYKKL